MKRPQFSLRLLFLLVALAAVLMAWRHAAGPLERHERLRLLWQAKFETEEKLVNLIHDPSYPSAIAKAQVLKLDTELDAIEKQINDLHPGLSDTE